MVHLLSKFGGILMNICWNIAVFLICLPCNLSVPMVLSRAQCAAIMTHILENVFDEDPDSNLHKSMKHTGIKSPIDLSAEDKDQLDLYEYPTDT